MHRKDRSCHWCGDIVRPGWQSPKVLKSASAIAAGVVLVTGSWAVREPAMDAFSKVYAEAVSQESRLDEKAVVKTPSNAPLQLSVTPQEPVASPAMETGAVEQPAAQASFEGALDNPTVNRVVASSVVAEPAQPRTDSIRWVPAVARTWVNVRSDASRGGDVVGVIKPDEKAMLGVDRFGWRQVRMQDVSGWVDPKLFEADSARTRG